MNKDDQYVTFRVRRKTWDTFVFLVKLAMVVGLSLWVVQTHLKNRGAYEIIHISWPAFPVALLLINYCIYTLHPQRKIPWWLFPVVSSVLLFISDVYQYLMSRNDYLDTPEHIWTFVASMGLMATTALLCLSVPLAGTKLYIWLKSRKRRVQ